MPCDMEGQATNIMWDMADPNVFVIAEQQALHIILYVPVSISGAQLALFAQVSLFNGS